VGGLGEVGEREHIKNVHDDDTFRFLSIPFSLFYLFYFILGIARSLHRWTDFDDQYRNTSWWYDVFLRKEVSFGGRDEAAAHLGVKSPKNILWRE